jgi:hypothetical protein
METVSVRTRTYWLSMHVPYACRHSGACCSSGWPIPIERSRVERIAGLRAGAVWMHPVDDGPRDIAGTIAMAHTGHCEFHRDGCEIHHAFGHTAMPSACQHFPRVVRIDPRGVFVTLSHYCPTAADLLFTHQGTVEIVEGPPALPDGEPEGLDARDVLPPLLAGDGRSGPVAGGVRQGAAVLMDYDGYSAWEAHMVRRLTEARCGAEHVLAQLEADLAVLQRWRPGTRSLSEEIAALPRPVERNDGAGQGKSFEEMVVCRYLAARAFASWDAFGVAGVAGVLAGLRRTLAVLRRHASTLPLKEAIRQTDLQVVHR